MYPLLIFILLLTLGTGLHASSVLVGSFNNITFSLYFLHLEAKISFHFCSLTFLYIVQVNFITLALSLSPLGKTSLRYISYSSSNQEFDGKLDTFMSTHKHMKRSAYSDTKNWFKLRMFHLNLRTIAS